MSVRINDVAPNFKAQTTQGLPAEEPGTSDGRTAATNATVRTVFMIGPAAGCSWEEGRDSAALSTCALSLRPRS